MSRQTSLLIAVAVHSVALLAVAACLLKPAPETAAACHCAIPKLDIKTASISNQYGILT